MGYVAYSGKIMAIGKYPACVDAVKCGVLHPENHEVGYATGSHAIKRRSQQNTHASSESQVFCQAVATRMAAKCAVVRAGRYYEAGIDSYTPLMVVWHRSEPIYVRSAALFFQLKYQLGCCPNNYTVFLHKKMCMGSKPLCFQPIVVNFKSNHCSIRT